MNSTTGIRDIQARAVLDEFERAVRDGATEKIAAIKVANPDLKKDLEIVEKHFTTVAA